MKKELDLLSILEKDFKLFESSESMETGTVIKFFDGIAEVYGLNHAMYGELLAFEGGNRGIVMKLDEKLLSVVMLDRHIPVFEREVVRRTGSIVTVAASKEMLGRIVNPLGVPLDGLGDIPKDVNLAMERVAPSIKERASVNRPFETGCMLIDALIPIGKGQRELLVGDRSTGKSSVIVDTILHQKGKNVICIYVSIGSKKSKNARIVDLLQREGSMEYTIMVSADADEPAIMQFLAPYAASSIAEYFMWQGRDVFIAYDDLSSHAVAYRELSLLLRRPPGREAYPGDIFYIHSRLLERACQLLPELGGGSITAMPVVQTLADDMSAYIPTNLISITDGQIIFDSGLFNQGMRPAINIGASVSRVGTSAQSKMMKKVQGILKLDLAQYEELVNFAKFGSDLDKTTKFFINRGRLALELLKQDRFQLYSDVDQVIMLSMLNAGILDNFGPSIVKDFVLQVISFVKETNSELYTSLETTKDITQEQIEQIKNLVYRCSHMFLQD